jgi:hypothetical protein
MKSFIWPRGVPEESGDGKNEEKHEEGAETRTASERPRKEGAGASSPTQRVSEVLWRELPVKTHL